MSILLNQKKKFKSIQNTLVLLIISSFIGFAVACNSLSFVPIEKLNIDYDNLATFVENCAKSNNFRHLATTDTNMLMKSKNQVIDTLGQPLRQGIERIINSSAFYKKFYKWIIQIPENSFTEVYYCVWERGEFYIHTLFVNRNDEWRCVFYLKFTLQPVVNDTFFDDSLEYPN